MALHDEIAVGTSSNVRTSFASSITFSHSNHPKSTENKLEMVNSNMSAQTREQERPRIVFIGAGSQGHAYAAPIRKLGLGSIIGICEPILFKQQDFGKRYIWGERLARSHETFTDWRGFVEYETSRRAKVQSGEIRPQDEGFHGADAAFICVLDEMHIHVIKALAPLGLHIMCEKPLATSLHDCIDILDTIRMAWRVLGKKTIFGIGHVLRYSPQNMLLRKIVRDDKVIGDIISMEHTEPVGWWHMAHSFVR
jgi:predicted dehydrogenase